MKRYFSLFRVRYINDLQYRTAAIAGCVTQAAWGFFFILLYRAFYRENPSNFPMKMSALSSYIWLGQAFLAIFMAWFFDSEILHLSKAGALPSSSADRFRFTACGLPKPPR
jgi:ABC-2 type transport system permease protein